MTRTKRGQKLSRSRKRRMRRGPRPPTRAELVEAVLSRLSAAGVRAVKVQLQEDLVVPTFVPRAVQPGEVYLFPDGPRGARWVVDGFCDCPEQHVLLKGYSWGLELSGKAPVRHMSRLSVRRAEVC